jgi:hypothetical protein
LPWHGFSNLGWAAAGLADSVTFATSITTFSKKKWRENFDWYLLQWLRRLRLSADFLRGIEKELCGLIIMA